MKKIDIVTFLRNYYGICHPLLNKNRLTHDDIKSLFPFIRTCTDYDYIKNNLDNGNVLMVYDKYKIVKYYYNPRLKEKIIFDCEYEENEVLEKRIEICLDDLDGLSKDELLLLRRRLRRNDQRKESYLINKMIHQQKQMEPRVYREKKRKILLKESIYD